MASKSGNLVVSDPIYGFTVVPCGLLSRIIAHPYFQRLSRIRQLGMAAQVYPGAQHTRKEHSLGAYHLMCEAFRTLAEKGHYIFDSEVEAAEAAILMHDLGHGPYSHVLEKVFTPGVSHEYLSLLMMERMNDAMHGELSLAVKIFRKDCPKRFLSELISSQLDVDRLDYLCRDSFYTGVHEGNIGAARLIKMLDVVDDRIVVDAKGIFSVENYLMARRLMYWQVYLHKTAVAAEEVLRSALRRAKRLAAEGAELFASPALRYFLYNNVTRDDFEKSPDVLERYAELDDSDVLCALKVWTKHEDRILSALSTDFVERRLFKVEVFQDEAPENEVEMWMMRVAASMGISLEEAAYFVTTRRVEKEMYSATAEGIGIRYADGSVKDVASVSHVVRGDSDELRDRSLYLFHQRLDDC